MLIFFLDRSVKKILIALYTVGEKILVHPKYKIGFDIASKSEKGQ